MRYLLVFLMMALAGCASAPHARAKVAWPTVFDADIARVAGEGLVDCGVVKLGRRHAPSPERDAARECMARARLADRPFKYGTLKVPFDFNVWEVFVQTRQGDYLFVQDETPLADGTQRWLKRCKLVTVDRGTGVIKGTGCFPWTREKA
jgi:hypothetical protein